MYFPLFNEILVQTTASVVGVFVGALAALAINRRNIRIHQRQRARTLLRLLTQELTENYETILAARPAYETTPWGKSLFVSMIAWETAQAHGDLPEILGYDLADRLAAQYGWLARTRYYVDLMTRLWLAPRDIEGHEEIRQGFRVAILAAMDKALAGHTELMRDLPR